jgi:hypothetical protein
MHFARWGVPAAHAAQDAGRARLIARSIGNFSSESPSPSRSAKPR